MFLSFVETSSLFQAANGAASSPPRNQIVSSSSCKARSYQRQAKCRSSTRIAKRKVVCQADKKPAVASTPRQIKRFAQAGRSWELLEKATTVAKDHKVIEGFARMTLVPESQPVRAATQTVYRTAAQPAVTAGCTACNLGLQTTVPISSHTYNPIWHPASRTADRSTRVAEDLKENQTVEQHRDGTLAFSVEEGEKPVEMVSQ
ncbi:Protein of unknown function [Pyronema omphalodes CBS 100304]|uniref:Uncharacterized protein n=1 Tax=Pyronema omphalodes (strain CBS 100304) TaxID=1076935 RepID=U4LUQ8_PYROM|nr:Protein of unknown function [Pyronema omphalodes CBS 100304]